MALASQVWPPCATPRVVSFADTCVPPVRQAVRLIRRLDRCGVPGLRKPQARAGGITLVQRFGSALNLNIHFHLLVADGIWQQTPAGPEFRRVPPPTQAPVMYAIVGFGKSARASSAAWLAAPYSAGDGRSKSVPDICSAKALRIASRVAAAWASRLGLT